MTDEEVAQAKEVAAAALPKGRATACILTKIDEARLWLGEVPATDPAGKKF